MIKFPINVCPLCKGQILPIVGGKAFQCSECVTLAPNMLPTPHYQVEVESSMGGPVQHAVVPPYAVETYAKDWRTRIFKWDPNYSGNSLRIGHWIFIMESEQIHPDVPEKLIKRIQLLVPFS